MKGGKRKLSSWNIFVKKVYAQGKAKNPDYAFKNALKDASSRKSEMGSASGVKTKKSTKKHRKSMFAGTRRHRRH